MAFIKGLRSPWGGETNHVFAHFNRSHSYCRLLECFGVTFVAITQQFNTTTSMGRLTLNILLSFAQFEREVTGERIRDKIAASKKKGMWMGGVTPLGYEVKDHKLIVKPDEAKTVRLIYQRYLELKSVRALKEDLNQKGIKSKVRVYQDGTRTGGYAFSRGTLYTLLSNPVYVGEIKHKDLRHSGLQEPILDRDLWDAVQLQLRNQRSSHRKHQTRVASSPLLGKLFDDKGEKLTPSHALKDGRRYRYYISNNLVTGTAEKPGWRLPAAQIEKIVATEAATLLADHSNIGTALEKAGLPTDQISAAFNTADDYRKQLSSEAERDQALATLIHRVELRPDILRLTIALQPFAGIDENLTRDIPLKIKRRGVEMRLVIASDRPAAAKADPTLLKEIIRAHHCFNALLAGTASIAELAKNEGVDDRYVSCVLPLAFLAPEIVEAIINGTQPANLTATKLVRRIDLAIDWKTQKHQLGF